MVKLFILHKNEGYEFVHKGQKGNFEQNKMRYFTCAGGGGVVN